MIAMVVVLPSLLVVFDHVPTESISSRSSTERTIRHRSPIPLLTLAGVATVILGFVAIERARFEDNLLELQATGLESVEWEHRVLEDSTSASWFAASISDSIAAVEQMIAAASEVPEIGAVRSVLDLAAPPSEARATARRRLAAGIESDPTIIRSDVARRPTGDELRRGSILTAGLAEAAREIDPPGAARLTVISDRLDALARGLHGPEAEIKAIDAAIQDARNAARIAVESLSAGSEGDLRSALPDAVRNRLIAPSGRFLVSLVPADDIWSPGPMSRFVAAIRTIDPDVTGVPITQFESLRDMRRSFLVMAILAVVLVAILVGLDFRRIAPVLIALTVLGVGLVWTIGVTAAIGVHLNVANFFAIPILIGIGIDSAIHMLHRADECGDGPIEFRGTRRAVVLTAVTTGIGFGSLLFASHRGLQSLGAVMAIGSLSCLLSTVVLLPALVRLTRPRPAS